MSAIYSILGSKLLLLMITALTIRTGFHGYAIRKNSLEGVPDIPWSNLKIQTFVILFYENILFKILYVLVAIVISYKINWWALPFLILIWFCSIIVSAALIEKIVPLNSDKWLTIKLPYFVIDLYIIIQMFSIG